FEKALVNQLLNITCRAALLFRRFRRASRRLRRAFSRRRTLSHMDAMAKKSVQNLPERNPLEFAVLNGGDGCFCLFYNLGVIKGHNILRSPDNKHFTSKMFF